jgi:hypothetical protein
MQRGCSPSNERVVLLVVGVTLLRVSKKGGEQGMVAMERGAWMPLAWLSQTECVHEDLSRQH